METFPQKPDTKQETQTIGKSDDVFSQNLLLNPSEAPVSTSISPLPLSLQSQNLVQESPESLPPLVESKPTLKGRKILKPVRRLDPASLAGKNSKVSLSLEVSQEAAKILHNGCQHKIIKSVSYYGLQDHGVVGIPESSNKIYIGLKRTRDQVDPIHEAVIDLRQGKVTYKRITTEADKVAMELNNLKITSETNLKGKQDIGEEIRKGTENQANSRVYLINNESEGFQTKENTLKAITDLYGKITHKKENKRLVIKRVQKSGIGSIVDMQAREHKRKDLDIELQFHRKEKREERFRKNRGLQRVEKKKEVQKEDQSNFKPNLEGDFCLPLDPTINIREENKEEIVQKPRVKIDPITIGFESPKFESFGVKPSSDDEYEYYEIQDENPVENTEGHNFSEENESYDSEDSNRPDQDEYEYGGDEQEEYEYANNPTSEELYHCMNDYGEP